MRSRKQALTQIRTRRCAGPGVPEWVRFVFRPKNAKVLTSVCAFPQRSCLGATPGLYYCAASAASFTTVFQFLPVARIPSTRSISALVSFDRPMPPG